MGAALQLSTFQETFQLAVYFLDRFLQEELPSLKKDDLQLVGVTALLLATKYEETFPAKVSELSFMAGGGAPEENILKTEIKMLRVLRLSLSVPVPIQFLRWAHLEDPGLVKKETHCLAKYILELSLVDYRLTHLLPSARAAAALALAIRLLGTSATVCQWTKKLEKSTKYSLVYLWPFAKRMAQVLNVASTNRTLLTIYRKFSNQVLMKVARLPVLTSPLVAHLTQSAYY